MQFESFYWLIYHALLIIIPCSTLRGKCTRRNFWGCLFFFADILEVTLTPALSPHSNFWTPESTEFFCG